MGGAIHLLAEEGEVPLIGLTADFDEQGAGAAGGVADGLSLLRREQLCQSDMYFQKSITRM